MLIITEDLMMSFKHKTDIQIRFKDIDQLGHVNNANHITYFETSRVNYFKDVFKNETNWKETAIVKTLLLLMAKACLFALITSARKQYPFQQNGYKKSNNTTKFNTLKKIITSLFLLTFVGL